MSHPVFHVCIPDTHMLAVVVTFWWVSWKVSKCIYMYIAGSAEGFKLRINCTFCWLFWNMV